MEVRDLISELQRFDGHDKVICSKGENFIYEDTHHTSAAAVGSKTMTDLFEWLAKNKITPEEERVLCDAIAASAQEEIGLIQRGAHDAVEDFLMGASGVRRSGPCEVEIF